MTASVAKLIVFGDCWLFTTAENSKDYPPFKVQGRSISAHEVHSLHSHFYSLQYPQRCLSREDVPQFPVLQSGPPVLGLSQG